MGNTNTLPVVSQVKSTVQLLTGDVQGAAETQEKFLHECPVVAQLAATGDEEKFKETNIRSVKTLSNAADGIPVVGHVKGVIHGAFGDEEGMKHAMSSATRSTAVIGGGVGGFLVGGPAGAVVGGIAGGSAYDGTVTTVKSIEKGTYTPSGSLAVLDNAINNPSGGSIFDAVAVPVFDGVAGYGAGQVTAKIQTAVTKSQLSQLAIKRDALQTQVDNAMGLGDGPSGSMTSGQVVELGQQVNAITKQIGTLEGKLVFNPKTGLVEQSASIPKATTGGCSATGAASKTDEVETAKKKAQLKEALTELYRSVKSVYEELGIQCKGEMKEFLLRAMEQLGTSEERRHEISQKAKEIARRIRNWRTAKKAGTLSKQNLDEDDDDDDEKKFKIRCVHWNLCGIAAQFGTAFGLVVYVFLYWPDVLLFNEIQARDDALSTIASILGYEYVNYPASAPRGRSMRGSAILYRASRLQLLDKSVNGYARDANGVPELEIVSADLQLLKSGFACRLASCYMLNRRHRELAKKELKAIADSTDLSFAVAGDLNMNKLDASELQFWRNEGLFDYLNSKWITNRTAQSATAIDYVLGRTSRDDGICVHRPIALDSSGTNVHFPIPFEVDQSKQSGQCNNIVCPYVCFLRSVFDGF